MERLRKQKKKNQKDQAMDLYKNKLAVCYKIKKENAKYDSISLFIYDMEKGNFQRRMITFQKKKQNI